MPAVLITRPEAASLYLAKELQRHGYDSVIEPLLTIRPTRTPQPDITDIQAVMITSSNALETLAPSPGLLGLPCFCVGPQTADKARAFGFGSAQSAASDGVELAQLIGRILKDKQKPVLHIAGRDIDSKAQDDLKRLGFFVMPWVVYSAEPALALTEPTVSLLKEQKLDAILVFSARTAETLKTLLARHQLGACCARLSAIGLSEAVADVLKPLPWRKLAAAAMPTENAVIARLKEILPVS